MECFFQGHPAALPKVLTCHGGLWCTERSPTVDSGRQGIKYNKTYKSYAGNALYVSTQGRKVTVFDGPVSIGDGDCFYGVRTGKSATLVSGPWLGRHEKFKYSSTSTSPKVVLSSLGKG